VGWGEFGALLGGPHHADDSGWICCWWDDLFDYFYLYARYYSYQSNTLDLTPFI
jgi:hypothetical protein